MDGLLLIEMEKGSINCVLGSRWPKPDIWHLGSEPKDKPVPIGVNTIRLNDFEL